MDTPGFSSDDNGEIVIDPNAEEIFRRLKSIDPADSSRHLALLYEFGRRICDAVDVERVVEAVVHALVNIVPVERCFVALSENGALRPFVLHRITLEDDIDHWPVSKTMLHRVLSDNVSLLTADAAVDANFANVPSVAEHNLKSVMAVPLGPKGACIGIIYADNRTSLGSFAELDLLFLTALSHYIYLGIRNAREFKRTNDDLASAQARCNELQAELLRRHAVVCRSALLLQTYEQAKRLAVVDLPLLLSGETGTGKELLARIIHAESLRASEPFVAVNLAAIPETLIDSELFGHEKGAFTDAKERRIGKLELADGGTLFLDEVADIPLHFQAKLLRALELGEFTRMGGNDMVRSNVRLVCATCQDLREMVQRKEFREDLYYRLVGDEIFVPPLRRRTEDVAALVEYFLKEFGANVQVSPGAMRALEQYEWPGNVRQLRNVVLSLSATSGPEMSGQQVAKRLAREQFRSEAFPTLSAIIKQLEREHIQKALVLANGNKTEASRLLGISKQKVYERIRQFDIDVD